MHPEDCSQVFYCAKLQCYWILYILCQYLAVTYVPIDKSGQHRAIHYAMKLSRPHLRDIVNASLKLVLL